MYQIVWGNATRRQLRRIDARYRSRIAAEVEMLAAAPFPQGYTSITGREHTYRIRIGTYRVIYEIRETEVVIRVLAVGFRGDVYNVLH